jgi:cell division protein FtsB
LRLKKERSSFPLRKKLLIAALGFFFLILLMASFFGKKGLLEMYRAQREIKSLLEEKERLDSEKKKLEKEIEELEQNPEAVEKKAREKIWLMKDDELVVIIKEK